MDAELDVLKARLDEADADARLAIKRKLDAARHRRKVAGSRLVELEQAAETQWTRMKAGVEGAMAELRKSLD